MHEIRYGLTEGIDVSIYASPEFNAKQMQQIRYGLETRIDVSIYAKPEFNMSLLMLNQNLIAIK